MNIALGVFMWFLSFLVFLYVGYVDTYNIAFKKGYEVGLRQGYKNREEGLKRQVEMKL